MYADRHNRNLIRAGALALDPFAVRVQRARRSGSAVLGTSGKRRRPGREAAAS